jgi:hypothetical protein
VPKRPATVVIISGGSAAGSRLHHARQHDDADEGEQVELLVEDRQREQRSENRRRQD